MFQIKEMVDYLFQDLPYSKETQEAKKRVLETVELEYDKQRDSKPPIQALGSVMESYGSLEQAGELSGFAKKEIEEWTSLEHAIDKKELEKQFRRAKRTIKFLSIFAALALAVLGTVFTEGNLFYLLVVAFHFVAMFFCIHKYRKSRQWYPYKTIRLVPEAAKFLRQQFDMYTKRVLNDVMIGIALFVGFLIIIVMDMLYKVSKPEEIVQMIMLRAFYLELFVWILIKNILTREWLANSFPKDGKGRRYYQHLFWLIGITTAYLVVSGVLLCYLRSHVTYIFNYVWILILGYVALILVYNLAYRPAVVFANVVVRWKRVIAWGMVVVLFVGYKIMSMDTWYLQAYISKVKQLDVAADQVEYDKDSGIYTITTEKEAFKILQLTDIHIGGSAQSYFKDEKALQACYDLIRETKPDFIVVTGDMVFALGFFSFSFNNASPVVAFSSFMDRLGIPWAFTYGNHDTEVVASNSVEDTKALYESLAWEDGTGTLLYPHVQPDIMGRNNQLIEIRRMDGSLREALFLIDSNDYTGSGINDYDYIHDDQVEWYQKQVERLGTEEGRTIPSMVFFHIPLQQYRTAFELYEKKSNQVQYFFGENKEEMINKVCCSDYPSKLFDVAKELGSTRAMFCGHDHYNNMSLEYEGIRLTYGMSIDYLAMPGIEHDTAQRGGTLITIHEDESYDVQQIPLTSIQGKK